MNTVYSTFVRKRHQKAMSASHFMGTLPELVQITAQMTAGRGKQEAYGLYSTSRETLVNTAYSHANSCWVMHSRSPGPRYTLVFPDDDSHKQDNYVGRARQLEQYRKSGVVLGAVHSTSGTGLSPICRILTDDFCEEPGTNLDVSPLTSLGLTIDIARVSQLRFICDNAFYWINSDADVLTTVAPIQHVPLVVGDSPQYIHKVWRLNYNISYTVPDYVAWQQLADCYMPAAGLGEFLGATYWAIIGASDTAREVLLPLRDYYNTLLRGHIHQFNKSTLDESTLDD